MHKGGLLLRSFYNRLIVFVLFPFSVHGFDYSELLEYTISWKYMTVGYSSFGTKKNVFFDQQPVWMFESTARANSVIQLIFPVEDRIISIWDPKKMRTLWHEKSLHEGNYKRMNRVHFNYDSKKAVWWQNQFSGNINDQGLIPILPRWKEKSGVLDAIPEDVQDILSIIYIMRSNPNPPIPGTSFSLPIFDDNRFSKVWIHVLEFQDLKVNLNGVKTTIPSVLVQPKLETSGVFRTKGNIYLWISNDEFRIPLKIEVDMPILGIVEAEISKFYLE